MQKPTSTKGRRIAAAVFLGAASTAMVAGTAHADGVKGATYDRTKDDGDVQMTGDADAHTALIGLDAPGSTNTLWTYCIQETVEFNTDETYDEHNWASASQNVAIDQRHLEEIKWILDNSYPQQTNLHQLATAAGVSDLNPAEAVEATQAAIWTFADASGRHKLDVAKEDDANVVALYNWLMTNATGHIGDTAQPQASLSITPVQKTAPQPGAKVAFTLTSNTAGSFISVDVADEGRSGAKLVDAGGKALAKTARFKSGDTVYVQLPATPATGSVTVTASGTVSGIDAGRVFLAADGKPSQNLILAQAQSTPVSASAAVTWAPATQTTPPSSSPSSSPTSSPSTAPSSHPASTPSTTASTPTTGSLAHTGAGDTVPLAGGALALLAAGGGMVVYTRRTRKQGSHS